MLCGLICNLTVSNSILYSQTVQDVHLQTRSSYSVSFQLQWLLKNYCAVHRVGKLSPNLGLRGKSNPQTWQVSLVGPSPLLGFSNTTLPQK